ncbi:MAG: hypothetical protein Kow0037_02450 [Calditrichia bacterium]
MRNTIYLIMTIVLCIGLAFAQNNTASVQQINGNNNQLDATQTGSLNTATLTQDGNENLIGKPTETDAKGVVQEGNENTINVLQQGDRNIIQQYRPEKNVFNSLYQKGDKNLFDIQQLGNDNVIGQGSYPYHGIEQVGNLNNAYFIQDGDRNKIGRFHQNDELNEARISQLGNDNVVDGAAQIILGTGPAANYLEINQSGNGNVVSQAHQEGVSIEGYIDQTGDNNRASLELSRTDAFGDIDQVGDRNKATVSVWKSGIGDRNSGVISQTGNDNEASQYVRSHSSVSHDNEMVTVQTGDQNYAYTHIKGSENLAQISQDGNENDAKIEQEGENNNHGTWHNAGYVTIEQTGNLNDAQLKQNGSDNEEIIIQRGNENSAILQVNGNNGLGIIQQYPGGSNHNMAKIIATGDYTRHYAIQFSGSYNEIDMQQNGDGNYSYIYQRNGDENSAIATQSGIDNDITVTQQDGNLNISNISQQGNLHQSTVTQTGSGNFSKIIQN